MKFVVCDEITNYGNSLNSGCVNPQVVEYIPPKTDSGTFLDTVNIDPVLASKFFMLGFFTVGSILIVISVLKIAFKAIINALENRSF